MKKLWWRIILAAVVLEFLYGGLLIGLLNNAALAYQPLGLTLIFAFMFLGGLWIGSKATAQPVLMGALVGVAAVALYTLLTIPETMSGALPISGVFVLNHTLKILGGAAGGFVGGRWLSGDTAAARLR